MARKKKPATPPRPADLAAAAWNVRHSIGTPVVVVLPDGTVEPTKTGSAAYVSRLGDAVCLCVGFDAPIPLILIRTRFTSQGSS